jgi:ketosteroid isomerase-like protein
MKPEKQPLLVNGYETTFVYMQLLGKHVPAAKDKRATIEVLLEMVPRSYNDDNFEQPRQFCTGDCEEAAGRKPPFREDLSA